MRSTSIPVHRLHALALCITGALALPAAAQSTVSITGILDLAPVVVDQAADVPGEGYGAGQDFPGHFTRRLSSLTVTRKRAIPQ